jgi:hypothetical protein
LKLSPGSAIRRREPFSTTRCGTACRGRRSKCLGAPAGALGEGRGWRGTATELFAAVEAVAGRVRMRGGGWPRSLPQFSGAVRRLAPNLRAVVIHVSFEREEHCGRRVIALGSAPPSWPTRRRAAERDREPRQRRISPSAQQGTGTSAPSRLSFLVAKAVDFRDDRESKG